MSEATNRLHADANRGSGAPYSTKRNFGVGVPEPLPGSGPPRRVDDLVGVRRVGHDPPLGHEQLLALVLHQDPGVGLEEARGGLRRGELRPGRAGGLGGARALVGGPHGGRHELVYALVVVDDVARARARDVYDVAQAVPGVHLVGTGPAVEGVLARAAHDEVVAVLPL